MSECTCGQGVPRFEHHESCPAYEGRGPLQNALRLGSEPATPVLETSGPMKRQHLGFTKREYFAAQAMQGLLAAGSGPDTSWTFAGFAQDAVAAADALLEELAK